MPKNNLSSESECDSFKRNKLETEEISEVEVEIG